MNGIKECEYCHRIIDNPEWNYCPFCSWSMIEEKYYNRVEELSKIMEFLTFGKGFQLSKYEIGHSHADIEILLSTKTKKKLGLHQAMLKCIKPESLQGPIIFDGPISISKDESGFVVTSRDGFFIPCSKVLLLTMASDSLRS